MAVGGAASCAQDEGGGGGDQQAGRHPNVIFIMADDLGYGEVGVYGQEKIRTPNLDRLAAQGMRFTQHYSGSPVCAPSRCVLLTGLHTGHAYIRGNDEMAFRGDVWHDLSLEGQRPLPPGTTTTGTLLQEAGYVTGAMGKWGLGGPGSSGAPNRQGFDHWFGYLGQRLAHNYYPVRLWRDSAEVRLEENTYFHPHQGLPEDADPEDPASYEPYTGGQYSHSLIVEEAMGFLRENADRPFFLYLPFTIPHLALQVPEEALAEYLGEFEETPYTARDGSYLPHRAPRAAYAAMITLMDKDIGRILDLVSELGLDEDTLVVFTSDNGPSWVGGVDFEFFGSQGGLRGRKAQLWEGGIRVPTIARWTGKIDPGTVTDFPSGFQDWLPTLTEVAGARTPPGLDGVSLLPTLLGRPGQQEGHDYLYWEYLGGQAVRMGDWKGIRLSPDEPIQLYDLAADRAETTDVAGEHPDIVGRIETIMTEGRTESELFPLRAET
jgi:arylsulfatase